MDNRGKKTAFSRFGTLFPPFFATLILAGLCVGAENRSLLNIADSADLFKRNALFFEREGEVPPIRLTEAAQSPETSEIPASEAAEPAKPADANSAAAPADALADAPETASETPRMIDLVVPNVEPTVVSTREFPIPFALPSSEAKNQAREMELIYSDDFGKTWNSYRRVTADPALREIPFRAPKDGEYWFAIRTFFQNGSETVSKVQKVQIESGNENTPTGRPAPLGEAPAPFPSASLPLLSGAAASDKKGSAPTASAAQNSTAQNSTAQNSTNANSAAKTGPEPDSTIVQGLLTLAGGDTSESASGTASDGTKPIDLSAVDAKSDGTSADSPEGEIVQPGKIKEIKLGRSPVGSLAVSVRWFRPDELGIPADPKNTVRVERADSAEGPWTAISENWATSRNGFWFNATAEYAKPFYLRTVSVDPTGAETIDAVPTPIDLSQQLKQYGIIPAATETSDAKSAFANVSLEKETPTNAPVDAWAPESEGDRKKALVAALSEEQKPIINKTASISQTPEITPSAVAPSANTISAVPNTSATTAAAPLPNAANAPSAAVQNTRSAPPTDPGRLTLNPIFTRGFGLFFQPSNERVDAGMPAPANPSAYNAFPQNGASQNNGASPAGGSLPGGSPYAAAVSEPSPQAGSAPAKRSIFTPSPAYQRRFAPNDPPAQTAPTQAPVTSGSYDDMSGAAGMVYDVNGQPISGMNGMNGMGINGYNGMGMNGANAMPDIIYEDANGNRIANPFLNQQGNQPMILPGNDGGMVNGGMMNGGMVNGGMVNGGMVNEGMINGGYPSGQTFDSGQYSSGQMIGGSFGGDLLLPNESGGYYSDPMSMAPMNGGDQNFMPTQNAPYSNQEQILGAGANLPGPTQPPVPTSVLPPKPSTR